MQNLKVISILYLVCCVGVIGQGLANIPQTKSLKFIAYCRTFFLGLHGLLNFNKSGVEIRMFGVQN